MSDAKTPAQIASMVLSGIGGAGFEIGTKMGGPVGEVIAGVSALLQLGGIIVNAAGGGSAKLVEMRDEAAAWNAADKRFDAWLPERLKR